MGIAKTRYIPIARQIFYVIYAVICLCTIWGENLDLSAYRATNLENCPRPFVGCAVGRVLGSWASQAVFASAKQEKASAKLPRN